MGNMLFTLVRFPNDSSNGSVRMMALFGRSWLYSFRALDMYW